MKLNQKNITLYLLTWLFSFSLTAQVFNIDDYLTHSVVFLEGAEGNNNYRIPSIVQAKDGTLIAIAEGRRDRRGDPGAGHIDLVYKLSYDGGRNWSSIRFFVKSPEGWGASNPTAVADSTNGRIMVLYNVWGYGRGSSNSRPGTRDCTLWSRYSDDNGTSWSEPGDITSQVLDTEHRPLAVFGPGHGIQTGTGRLVVPISASASFAVYSDDGGRSWNCGEEINASTNECVFVELDDGRLMIDARQGSGNTRWVAISHDEGQTWREPVPGQVAPGIHASVIRYPRPGEENNNLLLWSGIKGPEWLNRNPGEKIDHPNRILRTNLVLRLSADQGSSFPIEIWINQGPAAYADMTLIDNYDVGIIWEGGKLSKEGRPTGSIHFTRVPGTVIQKFIDFSQPK